MTYFKKKQKQIYSFGSRLVNIQHTCLRLGCSKLNHHLKENLHLTDDSSCACNYPKEDVSHFFLFCPLYPNIRDELLQSLPPSDNSAILEQNLFGNQIFCYYKIFEAVQGCIVYMLLILYLPAVTLLCSLIFTSSVNTSLCKRA